MTARVWPEPMVARVTGLKRAVLKAARGRALVKGPDWSLVNSVVTYSEGGLKKLLEALGLNGATLAWPDGAVDTETPVDGQTARPDPVAAARDVPERVFRARDAEKIVEAAVGSLALPEVVELRVVRTCPNPTILFARRGDDPGTVRVRVRSNVNFIPDMHLRAQAPREPDGLYFLVGNCPRFRGRY